MPDLQDFYTGWLCWCEEWFWTRPWYVTLRKHAAWRVGCSKGKGEDRMKMKTVVKDQALRPSQRRWWTGAALVLLLVLMTVMLTRMSTPRQPGMSGTGTITYGAPASPATQPVPPVPSGMPDMNMGGSGGK